MRKWLAASVWVTGLCGAVTAWGEDLTGRWLVIEPVGRYGRTAIHTDAIEAAVVAGTWVPPKAGDEVRVGEKVRTWREAKPGEDGWLEDEALQGGYAAWTMQCDQAQTLVLDAAGHSLVYVDGAPRAGDPYAAGWVRVPVRLKEGENTLLFAAGRGRLRAKLEAVRAEGQFNPSDPTTPDLLTGDPGPYLLALPVLNTTDATRTDFIIEATCAGGAPLRTQVPVLAPLSVRKAGFLLNGPIDVASGEVEVTVRLVRGAPIGGTEVELDKATLKLNVRNPADKHKRTFTSEIDGSVQYYAVTPAQPEPNEPNDPNAAQRPLALFLSLHGASVQATNQANAYKHKTWGHVVAPTNRRPFGFDWEDWGRIDALEVLAQARQLWNIDPSRIYLTGHSMGGHGTWQVGAHYADLFAAIGPSAAWPDFELYVGGAEEKDAATGVEALLKRASLPSRTLKLSRNYLHYGVYVLHGDADDNVPVELGRLMRKHLGEYHPDFAYYERPGAGHWWGDECMDWPPMYEFFKEHRRPATAGVRHVEFCTANPGIAAQSRWLAIQQQQRAGEMASVTIDLDAKARKFSGKTSNVACLLLDLTELAGGEAGQAALAPGAALTVELDEQTLADVAWPASLKLWLVREGETWRVGTQPSARQKGPARYGPFKEAFNHRVVLVYGTGGDAAENAAAYEAARYHAETFGYRGNGALEVIADTAFDAARYRTQSVVLYGNADTNAAWKGMLGESPVQVRRGNVKVGAREVQGTDLACLFVQPKPGNDKALVGVVGGSGAAGLRLTERMPLFLSGAGLPDLLVVGADALTSGTAGVRAAGFFGLDWGVESGEIMWSEALRE